MTAIVDTNIWLLTVKDSFALFNEAKRIIGEDLLITEAIRDELQALCDDRNKAACTALKLIQSKGLKVVSSTVQYADDDIIRAATANNAAVITNDADLINALHDHQIQVYQPRQRSYLIKT